MEGEISEAGEIDLYTFTAEAGQLVFFEVQEKRGLESVGWEMVDQFGTVLIDTCLVCSAPGARLLELGGTYTITVWGNDEDVMGTHRFQIIQR